MPAQVTNDLRRVIEGRDPSRVDVLIESEPGEGGVVGDALDGLGLDYTAVGVRGKSVFEATIPVDLLENIQNADGVAVIDHSPTFSPLGAAADPTDPITSTAIAEDAVGATQYDVTVRMGVEQMWEDAGTRGEGVKVGIVDTPIDERHPAIRDAVVETEANAGADDHGTWVAGMIAGKETEGERGRVRGVAPGVDLYAHGALGGGGASATEIFEGVEYLLEQGCSWINLSLGGPHSQVMENIVRTIREAGAVPVSSAGNSGPAGATITCPAHHAESLTVGSVSLGGGAAAFSSRGPGFSDAPQKPDVMGFGGSARVAEEGLEVTEVILGPGANGTYRYLLGTSMASPGITGVGALEEARRA